MADRCAWIGVLGSAFFLPCLDRRQREWIGACGGSALGSECLDRRSSRRHAPCLDRNFRKFGIERSENVGVESSFKEDSRTESHE